MKNQESLIISKMSDPRQIYQEIFSEKGAVNLEIDDGSVSNALASPPNEEIK